MKLKTFKTNWPLCNPVNILPCLTKNEEAIKSKYQKIRTWSLSWKYYLYTPRFSYQEKKIWQMIIHQQPAQPRKLQFCTKPELGMVWDPAFPRFDSENKNYCCVSILNKDPCFLMSLAKPELSHSLRHSCFLRAQKGFYPAKPWLDMTWTPRTQLCKPTQAPSERHKRTWKVLWGLLGPTGISSQPGPSCLVVLLIIILISWWFCMTLPLHSSFSQSLKSPVLH